MGLFSRMKANLQNRKDQKLSNELKAGGTTGGTTGGKSPVYTKSDLDKEISERNKQRLLNPKISLNKKINIEQVEVDAPKGVVKKTNQTPPPKQPLTSYQKDLIKKREAKAKALKEQESKKNQPPKPTKTVESTKTPEQYKKESEKTSANNKRVTTNQKNKGNALRSGAKSFKHTDKDGNVRNIEVTPAMIAKWKAAVKNKKNK